MFYNLCEFIKDELKELDRKASGGKLSMTELEYADRLSHIKKSLLTIDAMENPEEYRDDEYRSRGYGARRRDSMGRYRDDKPIIDGLHDLIRKAPDDHSRRRLEEFVSEMEKL